MATVRYERDAEPSVILAERVAVIGFGSQGHAHALNLAERGVSVRVGLHEESRSRAAAERAGFEVGSVREVADWATLVAVLAPDTAQPAIFSESIAPALEPGNTVLFGHGFNIRYGTITPPEEVNVVLIAPKGPGHRVRETYTEGGGVPALLAVHQDPTGRADAIAMAYAWGIGAARAGVIDTSFAEETETDLFGEQAVLCGGVSELVKAGFETLVEAGYQPEVAYFECLHELKLIVDLMYRGGLSYMRYSVSDTAEYGDYESGRRVLGASTRTAMKDVLSEIRDGSFAQRWIEENDRGRANFEARRRAEAEQPIEQVGARLREMMPFVQPVDRRPGHRGEP